MPTYNATAEAGTDTHTLHLMLSIDTALAAAQSADMDAVIGAREFAEGLGFDAFKSRTPMPAAFAAEPVLASGFAEGLLNARCEHEQVRAGLL
jgi:hypothetical protein